jgi:hypothetical protein
MRSLGTGSKVLIPLKDASGEPLPAAIAEPIGAGGMRPAFQLPYGLAPNFVFE